jgi:hypothetical protein
MNWVAISAISEVIGVFIIIISLAYVALQLRQNTKQLKMNLEESRLRSFSDNVESSNRMRELLILNPDLLELIAKGSEAYDTLTRVDKQRFGLWLRMALNEMQASYYRHSMVDEEAFKNLDKGYFVDELFHSSWIRKWLHKNKTKCDWRAEFRQLIEQRLALAEQTASKSESEVSKTRSH